MPGKSVNFFKLENEIFNIDGIVIKAKNKCDSLIINDIIIRPFLCRSYSEKNVNNHGILFDYPFGIDYLLSEKTEYNFELYIEKNNENETICFELDNDKYKINITEYGPITIDENVKRAIVYNIEDQTSYYEITNSIIAVININYIIIEHLFI